MQRCSSASVTADNPDVLSSTTKLDWPGKKKKKKGALICRAGLVLEWDWRDAWCDPEAKGGLVVYL